MQNIIPIEKVITLVKPHLDAIQTNEGEDIIITELTRHNGGWRVVYNTLSSVETGNNLQGLIGNVPLEVLDDGSVKQSV
jgi:hypothetical protein